jgi:hypothetical protein
MGHTETCNTGTDNSGVYSWRKVMRWHEVLV